MYVPAGRFAASTVGEWGAAALSALDTHGPLPTADGGCDQQVDVLVRAKLATEPIEDLRIDVEDGYGSPGDETEDADVRAAAIALARTVAAGTAPRFVGIRMKSLESPTLRRGIRSLDLFLDTLLGAVAGNADGALNEGLRNIYRIAEHDDVPMLRFRIRQYVLAELSGGGIRQLVHQQVVAD